MEITIEKKEKLYVFIDFHEMPAMNTGAIHDIKLPLNNIEKTLIWGPVLDPVGLKNSSGGTPGAPLERRGSSMGSPWGHQGVPKCSPRGPKGSQGIPKRSPRIPRGPKSPPRGSPKIPQSPPIDPQRPQDAPKRSARHFKPHFLRPNVARNQTAAIRASNL